jgi:hypothetical protein
MVEPKVAVMAPYMMGGSFMRARGRADNFIHSSDDGNKEN